jgi:hypothetical protein
MAYFVQTLQDYPLENKKYTTDLSLAKGTRD